MSVHSLNKGPDNEYRTQLAVMTPNHALRIWLTPYSCHNRLFCQLWGALIGFIVTESPPAFSDFLEKQAVQRWATQLGTAN